ncbi:STE24 endopeptidase [Caulobacter ginsengisoli]|uniref:STE24 endopeptidase n=1 Tax=Caulobacter ginsengisoli TaxID=400775 RepID=A0ABU0IR66_9CAUL|nr:M48 family metallopeptidase [Caulobacter ginsengisoli]MDQ0463905.1 STE24 endopeptidase [Caulobacter ginsengisoli]
MSTFDPAAATAAYLAQLPPEVHAKATAYTQGGHWLLLWGFVVSLVIALIIVRLGVLDRISGSLQKSKPRPWLTTLMCVIVFTIVDWVLELPWSIYADWWRETQYGLSSQDFVGWFDESAKGLGIGIIASAIFLSLLYALIRWTKGMWWLWAGGLTAAFLLFAIVLSPVLIEPIFNKYTPAPPGPVRDAVVAMAKANGVPSDKIFIYNGSKQSNRYTANVSGLFGSARVAMSDTMFKKDADLAEVRGVVGHEMGHYVHQHSLWLTGSLSLLAIFAYWLANLLFMPAARLMGARHVDGIADPTGLPVLMVVIGLVMLLATPVRNTIIRTVEADADSFSLQRVNEPDGLAKALVKTIEYRAATPGKLEEFIFYDHPSVSSRVRKAMDWKAAHMKDAAPSPAGR